MHRVTSTSPLPPRSPKGKEPESPLRSEPSFVLNPVDCRGESSVAATRALRGRVSPAAPQNGQPTYCSQSVEESSFHELMELAQEFISYGQLDLALEMTNNDLPAAVECYILKSVAEICVEFGGAEQALETASTASLTQMALWSFLERVVDCCLEKNRELEELFHIVFSLSEKPEMKGAILCTVESAIRFSLVRNEFDKAIDIIDKTWDLIRDDMRDHFADRVAKEIVYSPQATEIVARLNKEPGNKAKQLISLKTARHPHIHKLADKTKTIVIPFRDKAPLPQKKSPLTEGNELD